MCVFLSVCSNTHTHTHTHTHTQDLGRRGGGDGESGAKSSGKTALTEIFKIQRPSTFATQQHCSGESIELLRFFTVSGFPPKSRCVSDGKAHKSVAGQLANRLQLSNFSKKSMYSGFME